MENVEKKWWSSSVDPATVSLTLKGLLISLVPVILIVSKGFGWDVLETDVVNFIEQAVLVVGAILTMWGLVRKSFSR